jgi:hypothetical protein
MASGTDILILMNEFAPIITLSTGVKDCMPNLFTLLEANPFDKNFDQNPWHDEPSPALFGDKNREFQFNWYDPEAAEKDYWTNVPTMLTVIVFVALRSMMPDCPESERFWEISEIGDDRLEPSTGNIDIKQDRNYGEEFGWFESFRVRFRLCEPSKDKIPKKDGYAREPMDPAVMKKEFTLTEFVFFLAYNICDGMDDPGPSEWRTRVDELVLRKYTFKENFYEALTKKGYSEMCFMKTESQASDIMRWSKVLDLEKALEQVKAVKKEKLAETEEHPAAVGGEKRLATEAGMVETSGTLSKKKAKKPTSIDVGEKNKKRKKKQEQVEEDSKNEEADSSSVSSSIDLNDVKATGVDVEKAIGVWKEKPIRKKVTCPLEEYVTDWFLEAMALDKDEKTEDKGKIEETMTANLAQLNGHIEKEIERLTQMSVRLAYLKELANSEEIRAGGITKRILFWRHFEAENTACGRGESYYGQKSFQKIPEYITQYGVNLYRFVKEYYKQNPPARKQFDIDAEKAEDILSPEQGTPARLMIRRGPKRINLDPWTDFLDTKMEVVLKNVVGSSDDGVPSEMVEEPTSATVAGRTRMHDSEQDGQAKSKGDQH